MAYRDRISRAIAYIEANLDRDIRACEVAAQAACSLFHFHRIFLAVTGNTLNTYIRRRQMTRAARALVDTDTGIMDIALDSGFDSQEAFTRAFKRIFGLPPGKYRRRGRHCPSVYKNRFQFKTKGDTDMTPEIKEKKGFTVVGIRYFGTNADNDIPRAWDQFLERVHEIKHPESPGRYYGLCTAPEPEAEADGAAPFEYIAGVAVTDPDDIPSGMTARTVPDARYAVFIHKGALDTLKATYAYIYGEWAPKNGVDMAAGTYDFEFYGDAFDPSGSDTSELHIYVPLP